MTETIKQDTNTEQVTQCTVNYETGVVYPHTGPGIVIDLWA